MTQTLTHKLFKKIDGREIELDICISSGLVSVALVYIEPDINPLVLASAFREVEFLHNPKPQEMRESAYKALDILLGDFVKELGGMYELNDLYDSHQVLHSITIALAPLWVGSETRSVERSFDSPREITRKIIDEMTTEEGDDLLDISITEIQANGYEVNLEDIIGMETSHLDIHYVVTSLRDEIKSDLQDKIIKHFARDSYQELAFIPLSKVLVTGLRELSGVSENFSLLFLDAEDSTLLVKEKGIPLVIKQETYGRAEIKRQLLSSRIAPNFSQVQDILTTHHRGSLESSVESQIDYLLGIESQVLANLLMEDRKSLPTPFFVLSGKLGGLFVKQHVITHLESVDQIKIFERSDFDEDIGLIDEFVIPSVEILFLVLYRSIVAEAKV